MAAPLPNPFFEGSLRDGSSPLRSVDEIHSDEFVRLRDRIAGLGECRGDESSSQGSAPGSVLSLRAPRAGYGKTHLLARLRLACEDGGATVLALPFDPAWKLSWSGLLSALVPGGDGEGRRLVSSSGRHLLSRLLLHLLHEGRLSEGETPPGLAERAAHFGSLFPEEPDATALAWLEQRSLDLSQRAAPPFVRRTGLTTEQLAFWARLVVDLHIRGAAALAPLGGLSDSEARDRLLQWLRIAAFHRPLVLFADGLDGFHRSENAGMAIAELLVSIAEAVPRSLTLLALNDEVWESTFAASLPTAWLDRIDGERDTLRPISEAEARRLVQLRLDASEVSAHAAERWMKRFESALLERPSGEPLYPRSVLRLASEIWESGASSDAALAERPASATPPPLPRTAPAFDPPEAPPSAIAPPDSVASQAPSQTLSESPEPETHSATDLGSGEGFEEEVAAAPLKEAADPVTFFPAPEGGDVLEVLPSPPASASLPKRNGTAKEDRNAFGTRQEESGEPTYPVPASSPGPRAIDPDPVRDPLENPFFAARGDAAHEEDAEETDSPWETSGKPETSSSDSLAKSWSDIESIIADIRGSGSTIASASTVAESAFGPEPVPTDETAEGVSAVSAKPVSPASRRGADEAASFLRGIAAPAAAEAGSEAGPETAPPRPPVDLGGIGELFAQVGPPRADAAATPGLETAPEANPANPAVSLLEELKEDERHLNRDEALALDLPLIELLIRQVGARHPGLVQTEEQQPGSRSVCTRWQVHGQSVIIGFEPPSNVYFWSRLLQQSLSAPEREKIAAFSHLSLRFDPTVFSSFGYSPSVIRGRLDIIEMGDRELAMLYAAAGVLRRHGGGPREREAVETVIRYLDPLWRRISRTLD